MKLDFSLFTTTLGQLMLDLPANLTPTQCTICIRGISDDTRKINVGDLFIARAGSQVHGAHYIHTAIQQGAVAVIMDSMAANEVDVPTCEVPIIVMSDIALVGLQLVQRFYHHPQRAIQFIGITGTNGKTSVTHLVSGALNKHGYAVATIGTLGIGIQGEYAHSDTTTPGLLDLYKYLAYLRAQNIEIVVMEVSSHALDQGRVAGLTFDVVAFTNLSRDHLDYHGSMQQYFEAKAKLFQLPNIKQAVVNVDDEFGQRLISNTSAAQLFLTTRAPYPELKTQIPTHRCFPEEITFHTGGISGSLNIDAQCYAFHSPLMGRFNLNNLMTAAGCLHALSISIADALSALATVSAPPGRLESFKTGVNSPTVVVDYAHTPDALGAALDALELHYASDRWCVFGCGGERDPGKRPMMAAIAEARAQHLVITDDNPRFEASEQIIADILTGLIQPNKVYVEPNRAAAIRYAICHADPSDTVLIAGKGHENYQIIGDQRLPFDDRIQVHTILEGLQ